jgi:trans-2,3-dihydro-3-hydroxyanthranilate isomerase
MSRSLTYRLLNVFALTGRQFSGNPLCVFEEARSLSSSEMQAIARQFNLSETTFILPPSSPGATARVRIFTPTFEMPFAGHPTLGTAHVVRDLQRAKSHVYLEMDAGVVEVTADGDTWTLKAAKPAETRSPDASLGELASMISLDAAALGDPLWVDTGAEQLLLPVGTADDVRRAKVDPSRLARDGFSQKRRASMVYVWAKEGPLVTARFFFLSNGSALEDPATGSACANLGGYLLLKGEPLPVRLDIHQGDVIERPSLLRLHIDAGKNIFVSGLVLELGRGSLRLKDRGER